MALTGYHPSRGGDDDDDDFFGGDDGDGGGGGDDDDDGDFFDDDDDDDNGDVTTRVQIAWPPAHHESPVYTIDPHSVVVEKIVSGDDNRIRFTGRLEGTVDGDLTIKELAVVLHDADGAPIASEDTYIDRHVSGSAELQATFDVGTDTFEHAKSATFRLQYEYKFKKLAIAKLRFEPTFRKTEDAYRECVPFEGKLAPMFPIAAPGVTIMAGHTWANIVDVMVELRPAHAPRRLSLDVRAIVVDETGKRLAKDDTYLNLDFGSAARRFRFDGNDMAIDRARGVSIAAKGELEDCSLLGPFEL